MEKSGEKAIANREAVHRYISNYDYSCHDTTEYGSSPLSKAKNKSGKTWRGSLCQHVSVSGTCGADKGTNLN